MIRGSVVSTYDGAPGPAELTACERACAAASPRVSPWLTTVAPRATTASRFTWGEQAGMTIVAWHPARRAAYATDCAWLPVEQVTIPLARSASVSSAAR